MKRLIMYDQDDRIGALQTSSPPLVAPYLRRFVASLMLDWDEPVVSTAPARQSSLLDGRLVHSNQWPLIQFRKPCYKMMPPSAMPYNEREREKICRFSAAILYNLVTLLQKAISCDSSVHIPCALDWPFSWHRPHSWRPCRERWVRAACRSICVSSLDHARLAGRMDLSCPF